MVRIIQNKSILLPSLAPLFFPFRTRFCVKTLGFAKINLYDQKDEIEKIEKWIDFMKIL